MYDYIFNTYKFTESCPSIIQTVWVVGSSELPGNLDHRGKI